MVVKRSPSFSKTFGSSAFPSVITRNTFFASVRSVSAKSCSLENLIALRVNVPWSKSTLLSLIFCFKDKAYDKRKVICYVAILFKFYILLTFNVKTFLTLGYLVFRITIVGTRIWKPGSRFRKFPGFCDILGFPFPGFLWLKIPGFVSFCT